MKRYIIAKPATNETEQEVYFCAGGTWSNIIDHALRMTLQVAHSAMIYLGEDGYELVRLAND